MLKLIFHSPSNKQGDLRDRLLTRELCNSSLLDDGVGLDLHQHLG
jgi:hypothetical protein